MYFECGRELYYPTQRCIGFTPVVPLASLKHLSCLVHKLKLSIYNVMHNINMRHIVGLITWIIVERRKFRGKKCHDF